MQEKSVVQLDEDVGLMLKVKTGDRQAFARLYEKYAPVVKQYLAGRHGPTESREDMAQEVFTRIWRHRSRYEPLAPVSSYLLGVATNVLHESLAQAQRRSHTKVCDLATVVDTCRPSPLSQVQSAERLQAVRTLMTSLPPRQRQVAELVYLAGLDPDEAGRRLGCTARTVRVHLCLARRKLRRLAHLL